MMTQFTHSIAQTAFVRVVTPSNIFLHPNRKYNENLSAGYCSLSLYSDTTEEHVNR